jgi:hypothetical protein
MDHNPIIKEESKTSDFQSQLQDCEHVRVHVTPRTFGGNAQIDEEKKMTLRLSRYISSWRL